MSLRQDLKSINDAGRARIDADYTKRAEPSEVLASLQAVAA